MYKYSHIEALYQVARHIKMLNSSEGPDPLKIRTPVRFQGTVKLHGSNSGVVCSTDAELIPQSRNRVLTVTDDHMGFAAFVQEQTTAIRELEQALRLKHNIDASEKLVLFGEWVGPGIQNGMAINRLPERQWVLFAVQTVSGESTKYVDVLRPLDGQYKRIFSVHDVDTWSLEIDFDSENSIKSAIETFEAITLAVENECPWGKKFGIEGLGEGIVWIPVGEHWGNSDLFWKSKGPKHKEVKRAQHNRSSLDPEVLAGVTAFVEFSVTEPRLNKGIDYLVEMGHPVSMQSTGRFLKWVAEDIERECQLELQANGLQWKQVAKAIGAKAKEFFAEKTKTL